MLIDSHKDFIFVFYACPPCSRLDSMIPGEVRFVKTDAFNFLLVNKQCKMCNGTGIQAVPFGELRGQTYEAWKANPPVSEAPKRARKRRIR